MDVHGVVAGECGVEADRVDRHVPVDPLGRQANNLNRVASGTAMNAATKAPGRVFSVDSSAVSPWSRFNVGAVIDPRFARALRSSLRQLGA